MPESTSPNQTATKSPTRYSKATHLSEFYPYLNGEFQEQDQQSQNPQNHAKDRSIQYSTHTPLANKHLQYTRKLSSGTLQSYQSFAPSTLDFSHLITKAEIGETTKAFAEIVDAAAEYRQALQSLAEAAANLGGALENGAKCKGSGASGEGLLNASGLFFLVANHEQILAHSVKKNFEEPIVSCVNQFKLQSVKNEEQFKINIKDKITDLKKQEYENLKLSKLKTRNLGTYRSKLMELTSQIDDIDKLKHEYYQTSFDQVQDTSNYILTQLGSIIRAQVEIYEGIARKGWSGGGLDDLITHCPDPFAEDEIHHTLHEDNEPKALPTNESFLRTSENGLSFSRPESLLAQPTLSEPITSFAAGPVVRSNTPISKSTLIDQLQQQSEDSSSEKNDENRQLEDTESIFKTQDGISEQIADLSQGEDNNSFSLPMPGSSRGTRSPTEQAEIIQDTIVGADHNLWRESSDITE